MFDRIYLFHFFSSLKLKFNWFLKKIKSIELIKHSHTSSVCVLCSILFTLLLISFFCSSLRGPPARLASREWWVSFNWKCIIILLTLHTDSIYRLLLLNVRFCLAVKFCYRPILFICSFVYYKPILFTRNYYIPILFTRNYTPVLFICNYYVLFLYWLYIRFTYL